MQISVQSGGQRLDVYLVNHFKGVYTRSQINNSIKKGKTTLNGKAVKSGTVLRAGDNIIADIESSEIPAKREDIKIDIVFQDEYLLIINKPRGMVVHPGAGNKSGTLLNGLLNINGALERAGIVHRLDKNTAGLIVVAKTASVQAKLAAMFEKHEIKRTYIGLVEGLVKGEGTIDKNIARDPNHRTLYKAVPAGGRRAVTHYKTIQNFSKWTLVQFNLETGRTHQIRVHCKSLNHPLVGDPEYNPNSSIKTNGQLLESVEICFVHPVTSQIIHHKIGLTEAFNDVINKIG